MSANDLDQAIEMLEYFSASVTELRRAGVPENALVKTFIQRAPRQFLPELSRLAKSPKLDLATRRSISELVQTLYGVSMSDWLPRGAVRRIICALIVLVVFWQLIEGNKETLVYLLVLPAFSPRIVGECAYFTGRVAAIFTGHKKN